jgi:hypothetical protein
MIAIAGEVSMIGVKSANGGRFAYLGRQASGRTGLMIFGRFRVFLRVGRAFRGPFGELRMHDSLPSIGPKRKQHFA